MFTPAKERLQRKHYHLGKRFLPQMLEISCVEPTTPVETILFIVPHYLSLGQRIATFICQCFGHGLKYASVAARYTLAWSERMFICQRVARFHPGAVSPKSIPCKYSTRRENNSEDRLMRIASTVPRRTQKLLNSATGSNPRENGKTRKRKDGWLDSWGHNHAYCLLNQDKCCVQM
jgi:hypothetical protein